jgi:hypothetical protein
MQNEAAICISYASSIELEYFSREKSYLYKRYFERLGHRVAVYSEAVCVIKRAAAVQERRDRDRAWSRDRFSSIYPIYCKNQTTVN